MASVGIFETLRQRILDSNGLLPQERRAMLWFREYATTLRAWQNSYSNRITYTQLAKDTSYAKRLVPVSQARPGRLYFYVYQPEHARTLEYYDRFPFTLIIDRSPTHLLGLNFHYLDNLYRAKLFDALYTRARNVQKNPKTPADTLNTYIAVDYDLLNGVRRFAPFRPCIHSYLRKNIRTPLLQVGESEWDIALFLPVERFAKETRSTVWAESRKKITRG